MAKRTTRVIEAAGGVVWRVNDGTLEVLLVHRPKYDDWSLPKGKLLPGETHARAASREVREETGLRCERGAEVASAVYVDRKGRPKRVRYWAMEPVGGRFRANDEVDAVRWVSVDRAARQLSYPHDVEVVTSLVDVLVPG